MLKSYGETEYNGESAVNVLIDAVLVNIYTYIFILYFFINVIINRPLKSQSRWIMLLKDILQMVKEDIFLLSHLLKVHSC